jgi:hypothetical protein
LYLYPYQLRDLCFLAPLGIQPSCNSPSWV